MITAFFPVTRQCGPAPIELRNTVFDKRDFARSDLQATLPVA